MWLLHTVKKIKYSILCVTGVYFRDITNTFFVILHLHVSHDLNVCSSCISYNAHNCIETHVQSLCYFVFNF